MSDSIPSPADLVAVSDLAQRAGKDRSWLLRKLKSMEVPLYSAIGNGGQRVSCVTREFAEEYVELQQSGLLLVEAEVSDSLGAAFYLIRLMPQDAPHRVVSGWTMNLTRRLGEYRTASWDAEVLCAWNAAEYWERPIQEIIGNIEGVDRHGEHFSIPTDRIEAVFAVIDALPGIEAVHRAA